MIHLFQHFWSGTIQNSPSLDQILLDMTHLGRSIQSIAVLFRAHINRNIICHHCRCYTQPLMYLDSLYPVQFFFHLYEFMRNPRTNIISVKCSFNILLHTQRCFNLTISLNMILRYQFTNSIDVFGHNRFVTTVIERRPGLNFLYQFFPGLCQDQNYKQKLLD